jgi:EmrB/QacA subfamily drug resistance transporter
MDMTPPLTMDDSSKRKIVIGVMLAMFLAALDQTIISPALPRMGATLGGAEFLSWIIAAYFLTATAVTPLYGKFSDIKGRRPALFIGLGVFVVGSVICALAKDMPMMILGRAVQGLGGGGLIALAQTVIGDIVAPRERARYVVYFTLVWATASVAGPALGGFFAEHLTWRLVFWINLPLTVLAFAMTFNTLRGLPRIRRDHRLDVVGAGLIVVATMALMLLLTLGGAHQSWTSPAMLALGAAAVVLTAATLIHLSRTAEPLVPLAIFRNKVIGMGTAAMFFVMFAFTGPTVYLPIFLEFSLGKDATVAGAALIALLGGSVIGANMSGRYMPRIVHYKRMAVAGAALSLVTLSLLAAYAPSLDFWQIEVLVFLLGFGSGAIFPVLTVSIQNAADPRDLGVSTASLAFFRSLGSAIGVTVLGAIILAQGGVPDAALAHLGAAVDPALAERIALGSQYAFAGEALAVVVTLLCLLRMEERSLRSGLRVAPAPASE